MQSLQRATYDMAEFVHDLTTLPVLSSHVLHMMATIQNKVKNMKIIEANIMSKGSNGDANNVVMKDAKNRISYRSKALVTLMINDTKNITSNDSNGDADNTSMKEARDVKSKDINGDANQ